MKKLMNKEKKEIDKNLQTMTRILSYLAKLDADKQEAAYRKIGRLLAVPAFPKALNQITVEDYDRIMKGNCK